MKKYIIKYANGRECREINSYKSRNEASDALIKYLYRHNEYLCSEDDSYLSPFDFKIEEVEDKKVNKIITDFESARKALAADFYLSADKSKLATNLMHDINPKQVEALDALNKLFTIAQAWNKEDGFVPDFSDYKQVKWLPWFSYDRNLAKFGYSYTDCTYLSASACLSSKLCFKTRERAEQFGKQFEELYNKVFL